MTTADTVSEEQIRQLVAEYTDDRDCLLDFLIQEKLIRRRGEVYA